MDAPLSLGPTEVLPLPDPVALNDKGAAASTLNRVYEKAPQDISIQPGPNNATIPDSIKAAMLENTLFGRFMQPFAFDDTHNQAMPGYDVEHDLTQYTKYKGTALPLDDQEFLRKSVSPENFHIRAQMLGDRDFRQQQLADNPVAGLAALADPFDYILGVGVGSLSKLNRISRAATGITAAAALSYTPTTAATTTDHVLDAIGGAMAGLFPVTKQEQAAAKQNALKSMKEGKSWFPDKMVESFEGLKPEFKPKPGDKPSFMNGMLGGLKKFQSFYDEFSMLGEKAKAMADEVLGAPFDNTTNAWSSSAVQRNVMADAQVSIKHVEDAMMKAGLFQDIGLDALNTNTRNEIRAQREAVSIEAQRWLHREWRNHKMNGGDIPYPDDPLVRQVVQAYHESRFAENILRQAKAAGVEGAKEVKASRSYSGLVWNSDRVQAFINRKAGATYSDVAKAFGTQIVRQFGQFANSDAESIGAQFLKSIQGDKTGNLALKIREWEVNGLTKDEVINTMRAFGFQEGETIRAADAFFGKPTTRSVGDVTKSLRQRLDWDLDEVFHTENSTHLDVRSGVTSFLDNGFTLADFLEPDLYKSMNRYSLEMSSRIGLAHAGYKSGGEFQKALDEIVDEAVAAGQSPAEARATADHMRELALGRPIGDNMPEWVRTSNAIGSALALKNSGIYNLAEYGTIAAEYGYKETAKAFLQTVGKSTLDKMDRENWSDLSDIITGKLVADGRFRPVVMHLEDNFESATGNFHETVQYASQSVRFLNGSESIRRQQINMFAGLYQKTWEKVLTDTKGNAWGNAYDILKSQGVTDPFISLMKNEYDKHGWQMQHWNQNVVDALSTHALSTADSVVLAIRKGERPRIMDTMLGKVIFPYMSFVWSAHNKILRRHYHQDGVAGVAKVMAHQAPLAFLSAAAANVASGKPWDNDFKNGVPKSLSSIGLWTMPYDLISRGRMGGAFPGFAPVNSAVKLLSGPQDALSATQSIPYLGVFAPTNLLLGALKEQKGNTN